MTTVVVEIERNEVLLPRIPHGRRLRVLISAQAVSPVRGSEPGLGWNLISRLAQWHDVTVLCSPNSHSADEQAYRDEIETYLAQRGPIPGLTFNFIKAPLLCLLFQYETGIRRRTVYYIGYNAWQRKVYQIASELHAQKPFDIIHHLNITGYREPGYLWKLSAPFVWGPVTGAADIPFSYFPLMGWGDRTFYAVRNMQNMIQKHANPRCRAAARTARHIWAVGKESMELINGTWGYSAENFIESGAVIRNDVMPRQFDGKRPLKLVWSGQHIGRKALPILLHALEKIKRDQEGLEASSPVNLTILGEGPETSRWKEIAQKLGVADQVQWAGQMSHEAALREVSQSDLLVHTSVQEGTPHVVLEALSLGVPVLCHNACGMSVAVNESCGVKIDMLSPEASISGFADAIQGFLSDPDKVQRMSAGAISRAKELSWDSKAWQISQQYWRIAGSSDAALSLNEGSVAFAGLSGPFVMDGISR
ncbi:glycosyltransferase [Microvirga solisilvae]|uniref:glycosyltransferase n=1 Tax=Microvirga solisilvae TaxID=2919498 RepID=UPI001FAF3E18|nr:glycosyltransferase [Microvirga solisilvae]